MANDILKQYNALRAALNKERAKIQARLAEIQAALGGEVSAPAATSEAEAPGKPKRRMSAAGRAAIRAGAKARWAAYRAKKGGKAAPVRKAKKRFSAAARARISAAAKARWAKIKAAGKNRL